MDQTTQHGHVLANGGFLQSVLNAVPDNIAVINGDGVICFANEAWLAFGRNNRAIEDKISAGSSYFNACEQACNRNNEDASYAEAALNGLKSILNGARPDFTLSYPCHSDDELRWFTLRANPLKIEGALYILTSHADITQLKLSHDSLDAALLEARAANDAKSAFIAAMSHELRTPLNAVLGFSAMINEETFGPIGNDQYREYLRLIYYSGERVLGLVDDILDLTKVERGEYMFHDEILDIRHELESFLTYYTPGLINAPESRVSVHVDADAPRLRADARAFSQIVENLVSNALKFAGKQAVIKIIWSSTGSGACRLQISDNGPGIPEAHLPRVTEPFVRLHEQQNGDPYVSNKKPGIGLGMHIVSRLAIAHQAALRVQSKAGEGLTVSSDFPPERIVPTD